jgi:hypothetical protein
MFRAQLVTHDALELWARARRSGVTQVPELVLPRWPDGLPSSGGAMKKSVLAQGASIMREAAWIR